METIKIISERVMKAGYILRKELVKTHIKDDPTMEWTMAYTPSGEYIGDQKWGYRICVKRGIRPELRTPNHGICSIGFSTKDGKWYGWSHRAIYGFKIGSKCRKGDCHYKSRKDGGRGEWVAKTVADAKQMACDFAEGVA